MDCGSGEFLCVALSWVSENEFAASALAKFVAQTSGVTAEFIKEHGEKLIGLAGVLFGIWKWWRYREQILHQRLNEYLAESDHRVTFGLGRVLELMQRPAPGQSAGDPLFAPAELRSVLRECNWDRSPVAATVEHSADLQLSKAKHSIENRLETAIGAVASLRGQLASTNIIKGAIGAAAARREPARATEFNNAALNWFRAVLQIPGHDSNVVAKEFEAHQLRKLGQLDQALAAYEKMVEYAPQIADQKERSLAIARAYRYQAEILQVQSCRIQPDGNYAFAGGWNGIFLAQS